jgi:hypothetical protein
VEVGHVAPGLVLDGEGPHDLAQIAPRPGVEVRVLVVQDVLEPSIEVRLRIRIGVELLGRPILVEITVLCNQPENSDQIKRTNQKIGVNSIQTNQLTKVAQCTFCHTPRE